MTTTRREYHYYYHGVNRTVPAPGWALMLVPLMMIGVVASYIDVNFDGWLDNDCKMVTTERMTKEATYKTFSRTYTHDAVEWLVNNCVKG